MSQIYRIQFVHSKGIIYRDVKPENFAMGTGRLSNIVHIFDFGLAKLYVDAETGNHIPFKDNRVMVGTARYCGSKVHKLYGKNSIPNPYFASLTRNGSVSRTKPT